MKASSLTPQAEQALLVPVRFKDGAYRDPWPPDESAAELRELARSSGLKIVEELPVARGRPTPGHLIGTGKVEELGRRCALSGADVVVFGHDLDAAQQRNLEDLVGIKIIDRTQLILDIFAQRARSSEGKVQVELAQLQYLLPRLAGKGTLLSRLGGGIGTRGPGEQKLEMDRRRIRVRIARLRKDLEEIHRRRGVARRQRSEEAVPSVALIGYTNAGKTTLLNALSGAGAATEDRLFTTLDPLTRRILLPSRQTVLFTDTVGFLHRLPHRLIEAFRATLEEAAESDLLLHVLDASSHLLEEREQAVEEVLRELGAESRPRMTVLSQCDRIGPDQRRALGRRYPGAVQISAVRGWGLADLLDRLSGELGQRLREATVCLRPDQISWVGEIYRHGQVLDRKDGAQGVEIKARLPEHLYGRLAKAGTLLDIAG